jgi:hypothetical protein
MATSYYGYWKRPDWLAALLKYTKDGLLYWSSISDHLPLTAQRFYGMDNKRIDKALKDPNQVALIEVPLGRASHWVVATAPVPWSRQYFIADPLNTNPLRTTGMYGGYLGFTILTSK